MEGRRDVWRDRRMKREGWRDGWRDRGMGGGIEK